MTLKQKKKPKPSNLLTPALQTPLPSLSLPKPQPHYSSPSLRNPPTPSKTKQKLSVLKNNAPREKTTLNKIKYSS